ncbi:hypothetical protein MJN54_29325, partial [Salmonella enterica subsp. enterica serovar Kentucky]|nr:hypothetical protein [Salmonella enterica subsp. enterica serovar Kentucky]
RILTGSEGTLAFITEARLDITPIPKVRRLVNVKYDSFDSALRSLYVTLPCVVFSFRHCRTGPSSRRFSSFNPSMSASAEMMQNRE